jgi:hypothetical protein
MIMNDNEADGGCFETSWPVSGLFTRAWHDIVVEPNPRCELVRRVPCDDRDSGGLSTSLPLNLDPRSSPCHTNRQRSR